jgi:hypothetical protein
MKSITTLVLLLISTLTFAQSKTLSLEAGIRHNLPERIFNRELSKFDQQRGGFGFELMPKWNFSTKQSIGLNLGFNLIVEDARTDNIGTFQIISFLPMYKHELFDSKFSPFFSIGIGGYSVLNSNTSVAPGIAINLGTTLFKKLSLSFEYNKILSKINVDEDVINGFDNWYFLGVKFTYDIGIK